MEHRDWVRWRDILICIICVGIILWTAWIFLNQFVEIILVFLLSMTVAFLLSPVVDYLEQRRIPRAVGAIVVYVVVIALLIGFFYALVFSLVRQGVTLSETIKDFVLSIPDKYASGIKFLRDQGIPQENIDSSLKQITDRSTEFANTAVQSAYGILLSISTALLDILVVLVISFYLVLDGSRIRESLFSVVPQRARSHVTLFEDALNRVVGNYIRGQLTLASIIGVAVGMVCAFTGLGEFALIFGVLGFLFETIPMVGPALASISPIIASLLLPDPFPRTFIVVICFLIIQMVESNILGPRIVGHAVGLHPVASIMALLIFAKLFGDTHGAFGGAVGTLVATPLVAAIWVVIASFYRSFRGESADQILSRKRAPWQLRRPTIPLSLRLRRTPDGGHELESVSGPLEEPVAVPVEEESKSSE